MSPALYVGLKLPAVANEQQSTTLNLPEGSVSVYVVSLLIYKSMHPNYKAYGRTLTSFPGGPCFDSSRVKSKKLKLIVLVSLSIAAHKNGS